MKYLLIGLNLVLTSVVVFCAYSWSSDPLDTAEQTIVVPRSPSEKKNPVVIRVPAPPQQVARPGLPAEEKIAVMMERNIFDPERVPDAKVNGKMRNDDQIRMDMNLIGTYSIGNSFGAIILQRMQGNGQQKLKELQQKEYEAYQVSAQRVTRPTQDRTSPETPAISATNIFRQCLKVGDSTVNGYTLTEVTRTTATLTRNSETIELSILSPSDSTTAQRPPKKDKKQEQPQPQPPPRR